MTPGGTRGAGVARVPDPGHQRVGTALLQIGEPSNRRRLAAGDRWSPDVAVGPRSPSPAVAGRQHLRGRRSGCSRARSGCGDVVPARDLTARPAVPTARARQGDSRDSSEARAIHTRLRRRPMTSRPDRPHGPCRQGRSPTEKAFDPAIRPAGVGRCGQALRSFATPHPRLGRRGRLSCDSRGSRCEQDLKRRRTTSRTAVVSLEPAGGDHLVVTDLGGSAIAWVRASTSASMREPAADLGGTCTARATS